MSQRTLDILECIAIGIGVILIGVILITLRWQAYHQRFPEAEFWSMFF